MQLIIEDNELLETLWESGNEEVVSQEAGSESTVFVVPEGVRTLCGCCIDSYEKAQTVPDLREVIIPNSVERIEAFAFFAARGLEPLPHLHVVRFRGTLEEWCAIDKGWNDNFEAYEDFGIHDYDLYLLDEEGREYKAEHLVIPKEVKELAEGAFMGCGSLKTVDIPGDIRISSCVFQSCRNLSHVRLLGDHVEWDIWCIFETGDQSPFDETEDLEVTLSDAAAESLIHSESFDLKNTYIRFTLTDRAETLGEIMETVEYLEEEYHYKYGTPIGQDIIQTYRRYLHISQNDRLEESDSYDDESDAEDIPEKPDSGMPFSESMESGAFFSEEMESGISLPGGYHFDERMTIRAKVYHLLITLYRTLHAYEEGAKQVAEEVDTIRTTEEIPALFRRLPDLDPAIWETGDLMDLMDASSEDLTKRGALDIPDTLYERLDGILDSLNELCRLEGTLADELWTSLYDGVDWDIRLRLKEHYSEEIRLLAKELWDYSADIKKDVWNFLWDMTP